MLRWFVLAAPLAACGFQHGTLTSDGTGIPIDGPRDGSGSGSGSDAPPSMYCYGTSGLATVCLVAPPGSSLDLSTNLTIDTGSSASCAMLAPGSSNVCALVGTTITIGSTGQIHASGSRPLVLVATSGAINVDGPLDVASHQPLAATSLIVGAGGDFSGCDAGTPPSGGGGGEGGGFAAKGGDGGDQHGQTNKGTAGGTIAASSLHGGCAASDGGGSTGSRGHGGGAVLLIGNAINVPSSGYIDASGSGGLGAIGGSHGGGGGGSGGFIALDAPSISVSGAVYANGGGGGGGTGGNPAGVQPGQDPAPVGGALGGVGTAMGGTGGNGSTGASAGDPGDSATGASDGGGGGGGGAGVIRQFQHTGSLGAGIVSPPVS